MAKKTGQGSGQSSAAQKGVQTALTGMEDWNTFFRGNAQGAIDYGQNNPYSQMAQSYMQSMLGGSMANNPWMAGLQQHIGGTNMNEANDMLREFLGYPTQSGGTGGGKGGSRPTAGGSGPLRPMGHGYSDSGNAGGYHGGSGGGGGGTIPDSTVGKGVFSKELKDFFDDRALDPANDPTMQPIVDAIQRENLEGFQRSMQDLQLQMEGAGQAGVGGFYAAMMNRARDQNSENLTNALAQQYQAAREMALNKKMEALALLNNRDIASAQIAAQQAASAGAAASNAAAMALQERLANKQMQLEGIGMMMQGAQFGLGLQSDMAQLMQQGQLGALNAGLGYGQLGMSGYDAAANFGQLGLGALGNIAGINQNTLQQQAAARARQEALDWQKRVYNDQAPFNMLNSMINSMRGLNELGGYGMQPSYIPQPQQPYSTPDWGGLLGGLAGGWGAMTGSGQ